MRILLTTLSLISILFLFSCTKAGTFLVEQHAKANHFAEALSYVTNASWDVVRYTGENGHNDFAVFQNVKTGKYVAVDLKLYTTDIVDTAGFYGLFTTNSCYL